MDKNQPDASQAPPPSDQGSSPPSPSSDDQPEPSEGQAPFLTDPVMPEEYPEQKSKSPSPSEGQSAPSQSLPQPPQPEGKKTPPPSRSTLSPDASDTTPPSPPEKKSRPPAKPPASSGKRFPLIILVLLLLTTLGGGVYFYLQNQTLRQQLSTIQSQLAPSPSPTPTPSPTASPTAYPDSYPTIEATPTPTPSPTISAQDLTAFSSLDKVISLAQDNHPQAQLLMITADNILSSPTYKYWFRKQPDLKNYFFIRLTANQGLEYIATATVTPDNNIPDLISFFQDGNLGSSDQDLLSLAQKKVSSVTSQDPTAVAVKFLRARPSNPQIQEEINLWQFSFRYSNRDNLIVQYNAQTQESVYQNF